MCWFTKICSVNCKIRNGFTLSDGYLTTRFINRKQFCVGICIENIKQRRPMQKCMPLTSFKYHALIKRLLFSFDLNQTQECCTYRDGLASVCLLPAHWHVFLIIIWEQFFDNLPIHFEIIVQL